MLINCLQFSLCTDYRKLRETLGPEASGHYEVPLSCSSGPPKVLSTEVEQDVARYIRYRESIASPVSKSKVSLDLKAYIHHKELNLSFQGNDKPGKVFLSIVQLFLSYFMQ